MQLDGLKVAVLVTDGYEPSELTEPVAALRDAGADVTIVSDHDGTDPRKDRCRHRHRGPHPRHRTGRRLRRAAASRAASRTPTPCARTSAAWPSSAIRRCRQADRRDLPRPVDAGRGRCRPRPPRDLVSVAEDGPAQRRRRVGRRGGRRRPGARHQPNAEGPPGLQRQDARGVRRGHPRASREPKASGPSASAQRARTRVDSRLRAGSASSTRTAGP